MLGKETSQLQRTLAICGSTWSSYLFICFGKQQFTGGKNVLQNHEAV